MLASQKQQILIIVDEPNEKSPTNAQRLVGEELREKAAPVAARYRNKGIVLLPRPLPKYSEAITGENEALEEANLYIEILEDLIGVNPPP